MMISYQIPVLNPNNPQFYLPFGVAGHKAESTGEVSYRVTLDTNIYIVNTANNILELKLLFFDHKGNRLTHHSFVLGPHEALHESVFRMLHPHAAENSLPEPPAPPQRP
jgi:hypothetical protein